MKKTYVLDTNVLLSDPQALFSFEENDVIIPMVVLEELDRQKNRPDETGWNARCVNRILDELRQHGKLSEGVSLPEGGMLSVRGMSDDIVLPIGMDKNKADNHIIYFMLELKRDRVDAKLVSKDINVRLKCDALDIICEDYIKICVGHDPKKFYRGVDVLKTDDNTIERFFENKRLSTQALASKATKVYPNQVVVLKGHSKSALTRCIKDELVLIQQYEKIGGLKPRNKEQNFSFDLLLDPNVKLVTLVGQSGTGKTLLAIAAALEQHKTLGNASRRFYDRLIISRPIQPVGKDIGYLPGDINEKMDPWIAPIRDNLEFLMGQGKKKPRNGRISTEPYLDLMQENGQIEIEAITFIRGRSIPNSFIIIDEAQNLTIHELKTIITRVGEGTKIVLTGDIDQIDNDNVNIFNNGLAYAVEKFKEHELAGHITLLKGERSDLATLASQIL